MTKGKVAVQEAFYNAGERDDTEKDGELQAGRTFPDAPAPAHQPPACYADLEAAVGEGKL